MTPTDPATTPPAPPWWRFPMVWFALVEATSATTVRGARPGPMAPALQARNHAATPPSRP